MVSKQTEELNKLYMEWVAALKANPRLAAALYGRGVAKLKLGESSGSNDMASAEKINPNIAPQMEKLGVVP